MVGDYLKRSGFLVVVSRALEVIKWFNSHSAALDLFRKEQISTYTDYAVALSLILPVLTRWTTHYLAITRLLRLKLAMRTCCMKYESRLLVAAGKKHECEVKAQEIIDTVNDDLFWRDLVQ